MNHEIVPMKWWGYECLACGAVTSAKFPDVFGWPCNRSVYGSPWYFTNKAAYAAKGVHPADPRQMSLI